MAGERERYLRQQAELGGREVILSARRARAEGPPATPAPPVATVGQAPPSVAPEPEWRKGAPPVPGPGLIVTPPMLLDAEIGGLATLAAVAEAVRSCRRCPLCETRTHAVPGDGDPAARLVVVGEGPGQTEDETGLPFVGRAGELLDKILLSIGVPRATTYILNIVKCRPPQNRTPLPDEIAACIPYLHRQLALIGPKVILAAGSTAAGALLQTKKSLGQLRGQVHRYGSVPVVVTYHPAALLRNPNWKKPTWDDVRIARQLLDA